MFPSTDEERGSGYRHADPVMDQALDWFLKLRAEDADPEAFEAWIAGHPDRAAALSRVTALWDCPEVAAATAEVARKGQTAQTAAAAPPEPLRPRRRVGFIAGFSRISPVALAASLLAAVALTTVDRDWFFAFRADHRTGAGEIATITLPDGSRMQLNSRTSVMLDFEDGRRAVRIIEGEAWFEVAHDTAHPFTVTGGFGTVEVTGTRFDVARRDEADVVHLESGGVRLTRDEDGGQTLAMTPGQTAAVSRSAISMLPDDDTDIRLSWREGWIQLSGVPLRQALAEIGRHTGDRIVTLPGAALDTPVSGSFRIEAAEAAIEAVTTAAGATLDRLPGGILIIR
ncbi:FecR domain-containing protein [Rhizobium sp. AAP43]|uniref:FecR family protein n=1 Tax=Rhizobium sp. AAP43 TaxID=1523420 RepID=UPI0006B9F66F|nr:FecR domain-containing protein [Rhizobium sp. AAP43]KPF46854.1 hypothetical protein IP76_02975 [Rhizobium sp. AAP43]